ncbi:MAG: IS3 family transposase [Planctomycetes bacterium]|nr:IS3 family transposase [Planctomycetota bacterium]
MWFATLTLPQTGETYDSPRIYQQLKREGFYVGEARIEWIMRENRIQSVSRTLYKPTPWMTKFFGSTKNKIKDIKLTGVNQVWLTDITYLKVNGEYKYMATVLDKFSRRLLACSIGEHKSSKLTKRVLKERSWNGSLTQCPLCVVIEAQSFSVVNSALI